MKKTFYFISSLGIYLNPLYIFGTIFVAIILFVLHILEKIESR